MKNNIPKQFRLTIKKGYVFHMLNGADPLPAAVFYSLQEAGLMFRLMFRS